MFNNHQRQSFVEALGKVFLGKHPEKSSALMQAYATFHAIANTEISDFQAAYEFVQIKFAGFDMALLRGLDFSDEFVSVSNYFLQFDFIDFLRWTCPDVVCNFSVLRDCFNRNFQKNILLTVQHIICTKLVPIKISENETVLDSDHYDEAIKKIYRTYCRIEKNDSIRLEMSVFQKLYEAVNQYALDSKEQFPVKNDAKFSKNEKLLFAMNSLWDLGLSRSQQEEFIYRYFVEAESCASLISRFKISNLTRVKDSERRVKKAKEVCGVLASFDPLDCLCAIKVFRQMEGDVDSNVSPEDVFISNDIALENGLIYALFSSAIPCSQSSSGGAAVLFPSPFFIRKWVKDHALDNAPVTFVMRNSYEAAVCRYAFLSDRIRPEIITLDEWNYAVKTNGVQFSQCLIFACKISVKEQNEIYRSLKMNCDNSVDVYSLISSHEFETALSPFSPELSDSKMDISSIAIIPQGINNSSQPRRKIFIKCVVNPTRENVNSLDSTLIYTYTINTDLKKQTLSRLMEEPVKCPKNLVVLYSSIRELYRSEVMRRRAAGRTRVASVSYEFTRDISIWFSKSYPSNNLGRPRIEAYVCEAAPYQKVQRGYTDKGSIIQGTKKHVSRLPDNNIFAWLEYEYPFSSLRPRHTGKELKEIEVSGKNEYSLKPIVDIREEIIAAYAPLLEGKDISVKTFWYIRPDLEDLMSAEDYCMLGQIARSDIGYCRFSELDAERCEELLTRCFEGEPSDTLLNLFEIISFVIDEAVEFGYAKRNPIKEVIERTYLKDKLFAQVRAALVKKYFTADEMIRAYKEIKKRLDQGKREYLGVLIRLLTGLESNIVCALKYKNYICSEDYGIKQLLITCQLTNDGLNFKAFTKLEDYRKIPCMLILQKELDEQCEIIKTLIDEATDMMDLPILTTMDVAKRGNRRGKHYAPKQLDKLCKEIFEIVGVTDRIIEIPDSNGGTKETNLSRYGGDFFKENFRYWAREQGKLQKDEIQYLIGNKPATTFGRYYCDFLNDAIQLMMQVKLRRWEVMFSCPSLPNGKRWISKSCSAYEREFAIDGTHPLQLNVELLLDRDNKTITVEAISKFGVSVNVAPVEVER